MKYQKETSLHQLKEDTVTYVSGRDMPESSVGKKLSIDETDQPPSDEAGVEKIIINEIDQHPLEEAGVENIIVEDSTENG